MAEQDRSSKLVGWFCYSIVIPVAITAFRGVVQLLFFGPTDFHFQDLLSTSEVAFLAAVIAAETLGQALIKETANSPTSTNHNQLTVIGVILLLLLMASTLIAGLAVLSETPGSEGPFLTTEAGRNLLFKINLLLILAVFIITFLARAWLPAPSLDPSEEYHLLQSRDAGSMKGRKGN